MLLAIVGGMFFLFWKSSNLIIEKKKEVSVRKNNGLSGLNPRGSDTGSGIRFGIKGSWRVRLSIKQRA